MRNLWRLNVNKVPRTILRPQPVKIDEACHHHCNHHHYHHNHYHHHDHYINYYHHPLYHHHHHCRSILTIIILTTFYKMRRVAVGSEFGPQPCLTFLKSQNPSHPLGPAFACLPPQTSMAWMAAPQLPSILVSFAYNSSHPGVCSALEFSKQFHKIIIVGLFWGVLFAGPVPCD